MYGMNGAVITAIQATVVIGIVKMIITIIVTTTIVITEVAAYIAAIAMIVTTNTTVTVIGQEPLVLAIIRIMTISAITR